MIIELFAIGYPLFPHFHKVLFALVSLMTNKKIINNKNDFITF
jgi:hypothetical protein